LQRELTAFPKGEKERQEKEWQGTERGGKGEREGREREKLSFDLDIIWRFRYYLVSKFSTF